PSAEHLPRSINVIDTPSSVPRAVRFLSFDQIVNRIPDATRLRIETDVAEQLQCAGGQIAASWIENRVVIRERHIFQPRGGNIFIKRRPAAIAALEAELPAESAPKGPFQSPTVLRPNESQRHQHHRGVVNIGIINVVLSKGPAD